MATEPGVGNVLFISHNAADQSYAVALDEALQALVDDPKLIDVRYSTSKEAGPEGGESWREWIYRCVVQARTTLIVVTPHALGKPWLLWEAGAVKGAALLRESARRAGTRRGRAAAPSATAKPTIVSLAYGLPNTECPDPLRGEQIIQGTDVAQLEPLFARILQAHGAAGDALIKAGHRMEKAFERYLAAVDSAMRRAPSLVNEANVQDWLTRLDTLAREKRLSELSGFERWMMLAFGRDSDEDARTGGIPIDVRLHRRLGELYLGQKQYQHAVRQLRLAWRAAPRDIFVLRPLAEASMKSLLGGDTSAADASARDEIKTLLGAIGELDDRAYTTNPESAGLLAKYYRRVLAEPQRALDVYQKALAANPDSYYLADLVAQTELELGQSEAAQAHFRDALEIIDRLAERNIWSHATAATACVGLADLDGARRHLLAMHEIEPPPSELQVDSIGHGIREVGARTGVAPDDLNGVLLALDPRGEAAV